MADLHVMMLVRLLHVFMPDSNRNKSEGCKITYCKRLTSGLISPCEDYLTFSSIFECVISAHVPSLRLFEQQGLVFFISYRSFSFPARRVTEHIVNLHLSEPEFFLCLPQKMLILIADQFFLQYRFQKTNIFHILPMSPWISSLMRVGAVCQSTAGSVFLMDTAISCYIYIIPYELRKKTWGKKLKKSVCSVTPACLHWTPSSCSSGETDCPAFPVQTHLHHDPQPAAGGSPACDGHDEAELFREPQGHSGITQAWRLGFIISWKATASLHTFFLYNLSDCPPLHSSF